MKIRLSSLRSGIRAAQVYTSNTTHSISGSGDVSERIWNSARYLPRWLRHRHLNMDAWLDREMPWITFEALDYLRSLLQPSHIIFEYGCGGSTLFFTGRAASVNSVEHDPSWHAHVSNALVSRSRSNFTLQLAPPEPDGEVQAPELPGSFGSNHLPGTFRAYVTAIDGFPDGTFDLVFIDGRARPSCMARAMPKLRPGGYLVLDNSERREYSLAAALLQDWTRTRTCWGPGPLNDYFWETSFWRKPETPPLP